MVQDSAKCDSTILKNYANARVSASKFVALDTDKFGSINKEWLDFPETTPDL